MLVGKISLLLVLVSTAVGVVSCQKDDSAKPAAGGHDGGHGTPKDWKFTLGKGDAAEGRRLFVEIECHKCHEIKGESFPSVAADEKDVGPELSQMAGMHPIEFFAESIANPDAVIDADAKEQGYVGTDGKSKMPGFADVLTVKQLTDLATYLASLGGGHKH